MLKKNIFKKIAIAVMLSSTLTGFTTVKPTNLAPKTQIVEAAKKRRFQKVTVNFDNQYHIEDKYMRSSIKEAIREWNEASRTNFVYTNRKHADITIYTYRFKDETLGSTDPKRHGHVDIFIDPDAVIAREDYLENAIAHELGHAMGLPHSSEKKSIMYYSDKYNDEQEITKKDAKHANECYPHFWSKYYQS